jgi:hypothetical protein
MDVIKVYVGDACSGTDEYAKHALPRTVQTGI